MKGDKVWRYQHAIIDKTCKECGNSFQGQRSLVSFCSDDCKKAHKRRGRPQTFRECAHCGVRFGPIDHLSRRFCSNDCKVAHQTTGRKVIRKTIREARNAQSLLAYHIRVGHIVKPTSCEECGKEGRIDGAHKDYSRPLDVRWLCRSCHIKWDKAEPKGVTYAVPA